MIKGKGISSGIGIGKIVKLNSEEMKINNNKIEDVNGELKLLYDSINIVANDTRKLISRLTGTEKEIMEAYLTILEDETLIKETKDLIEKSKYNAAFATEAGLNNIIMVFKNMDDSYMAERARDIEDMKRRIIRKILKKAKINLSDLPNDSIIVSSELSTSDTAKIDLNNIAGIITSVGGETSHVAIMAKTNMIPAVTGISDLSKLKDEQLVIINGKTGEIILNPSIDEIEEYKIISLKFKNKNNDLKKYLNNETITSDGKKVELYANIGRVQDSLDLSNKGAEGIGLFRTEFLYMDSQDFPTEEEQFIAYKIVAERMKEKNVIIRTLDVGGDKDLKYMKLPKEENPFLGYRAIRICLDNVKMFKIQLRAILRASYFGNISIMLPMISSIEELEKCKEIIKHVKEDLDEEKILYNKNIKVGIMIEIPSAALSADMLAKECDFFSIGTNDLIQYTLAVERGNNKVSNIYDKYNPAVIKLIKHSIDAAHNNGIQCGVCGESAGDEIFSLLLVGLGIDELSMNISKLLEIRKNIMNCEYKELQKVVNKILMYSKRDDIENELKEYLNLINI